MHVGIFLQENGKAECNVNVEEVSGKDDGRSEENAVDGKEASDDADYLFEVSCI